MLKEGDYAHIKDSGVENGTYGLIDKIENGEAELIRTGHPGTPLKVKLDELEEI